MRQLDNQNPAVNGGSINGIKYFSFCGSPGSLHKVTSDIVWSSLRVEGGGLFAGRIDFDAGHFNDLHPYTLPEFFDLMAVTARLMEALKKMDQKSVVCTGYPDSRIRCISTYSSDVSVDLIQQCARALDTFTPSIFFVVDAEDEILKNRVNARKRDSNMSVLECMIKFYREIKGTNVVHLDTTDGPKEAADEALVQIKKALNP